MRSELDVFDARRAADRIARASGFSSADAGVLRLVVSELGYNIVRHAEHGQIGFSVFNDPQHGTAVQIDASDHGPPIPDLALAIRDGHDGRGPLDPARLLERQGIGSGLGAIVRLSHDFRYERTGTGNRFVVVRYRRGPRAAPPKGR